MCTIKGLQRTLRKRLHAIDRWGQVSVYNWNDTRLPEFIPPDKDHFYIVWTEPRRSNIHPYEYKRVPLSDIAEVRRRNRDRLRNKTVSYK